MGHENEYPHWESKEAPPEHMSRALLLHQLLDALYTGSEPTEIAAEVHVTSLTHLFFFCLSGFRGYKIFTSRDRSAQSEMG
jgi:hypothetical protein